MVFGVIALEKIRMSFPLDVSHLILPEIVCSASGLNTKSFKVKLKKVQSWTN